MSDTYEPLLWFMIMYFQKKTNKQMHKNLLE